MFSRVPVGEKRGPKGADGGIQIGSRRMQQKWKDLQAGVTALDVRNTATYLVQGSPLLPVVSGCLTVGPRKKNILGWRVRFAEFQWLVNIGQMGKLCGHSTAFSVALDLGGGVRERDKTDSFTWYIFMTFLGSRGRALDTMW